MQTENNQAPYDEDTIMGYSFQGTRPGRKHSYPGSFNIMYEGWQNPLK